MKAASFEQLWKLFRWLPILVAIAFWNVIIADDPRAQLGAGGALNGLMDPHYGITACAIGASVLGILAVVWMGQSCVLAIQRYRGLPEVGKRSKDFFDNVLIFGVFVPAVVGLLVAFANSATSYASY
jgi:hypothetical protein